MNRSNLMSDWVNFNSSSPYTTRYRRLGNTMEIRGNWTGKPYDSYEEASNDSEVLMVLSNHNVATILPVGLNIFDQNVILPERSINLFCGKYINSLKWMTKQYVEGWRHEV